MHFSQYDLDQISGDTLAHLSPEQLLLVSERILSDLTEAMDLLNQRNYSLLLSATRLTGVNANAHPG